MYRRNNRKQCHCEPSPDLSLSSDSEDDAPRTAPTEILQSYHVKITDAGTASQTLYTPFQSSPKRAIHPLPNIASEEEDDSEVPEIYDARLDSLDFTDYNNAIDDDEEVERVQHLGQEGKTRNRGPSSFVTWANDKDEQNIFLQEFLRLEGRGEPRFSSNCADCDCPEPNFRCEDCFGPELLCQPCIVKDHQRNPFHKVQRWNGSFFERTTLKALGLSIHLNHTSRKPCINPKRSSWNDFAIIDSSGVHEVNVLYCDCQIAPAHGKKQQLLRWKLFPSTSKDPCTATTFECLKQYHILAFEGAISMFAYYYSLARLTDNTTSKLMRFHVGDDIDPSIDANSGQTQKKIVELDLYTPFRTMVRKWRFIKMCLRSGQGHNDNGVYGIQPGALAVQCPACPIPGVNLPEGWLNSPPFLRWLYKRFYGIDGNFQLQSKTVSTYTASPATTNGLAYTVESKAFMDFIESYTYKQAGKTAPCVSHKAIRDAESKGKDSGLRATGIGSIDCSRHEMKRPLSSGDFQVGERYRNMDYFLASSLKNTPRGTTISLSYDIACQWSTHLPQRLDETMPVDLHIDPDMYDFEFHVPKHHLAAHILKCILRFNFNYSEYVGRTDGEAPERLWRYLNSIASMIREMGPGARVDTLNDFMGDWNWKKVIKMSTTLSRKLKAAVPEAQRQIEALEKYEDVMFPQDVQQWKTDLQAWQADKSQPNPFESKAISFSEQEVRLQVLKAEEAEMKKGQAIMLHKKVGPLSFISAGMDLAATQLRLRINSELLQANPTVIQELKITQEGTTLQKSLNAWLEYQALYCPGAVMLRSAHEERRPVGSPPIPAYDIPLFLPSQISSLAQCDKRLQGYEWKLRMARIADSLNKIRTLIAFKTALRKHKYRFARGQKANTRSNSSIQNANRKIEFQRQLYEQDRAALIKLQSLLHKSTEWQGTFLPLRKKDIRPLSDEDAAGLDMRSDSVAPLDHGKRASSKKSKQRRMTWIWTVKGVAESAGDSADAKESLRIEWCKLRMGAHSWACEVQLLVEEMRRVQASFEFKSRWWDELAHREPLQGQTEVMSGMNAYAARQRSMWQRLAREAKGAYEEAQKLVGKEGHQINEDREVGQRLHDTGESDIESDGWSNEESEDEGSKDSSSENESEEDDMGENLMRKRASGGRKNKKGRLF